jgi:mediator of RNA polymerase II transcription subunit 21
MTDRLTQLQLCLNQLATQMYATLHYTSDRATPSRIPDLRYQISPARSNFLETQQTQSDETQTQTTTQQSDPTQPQNTQTQPQSQQDSATQFTADLHELARDLILKEQQIELLIDRLPGIGTSERAQRERMRELEQQLQEIEVQRREAVAEKEVLLELVAGAIVGVKGV